MKKVQKRLGTMIALCVSLIFCMLASIPLMSSASAQTSTGTGPEIVHFEFALKLPSVIDAVSWFPDNKALVVKSDGLRLVDTDARSISLPLPIARLPSWPRLFVSPDGVYLAVLSRGLKILSTTDWQSMPAEGSEEHGCLFSEPGSLRFTSDSRFIWIACEPRTQTGQTAIAIKLHVPDLQVVDTIQSNIPGASFAGTVITPNSDDVIERAHFYTDKRNPQRPTQRWFRTFVGATNLGDKSIVMAPKDITPDVGDSFHVHNDAVSADHGIYVLDQSEPDPAFEPRILAYATSSLQRVAQFGFKNERISGSRIGWSDISNLLLLKGTDLAIAALRNANYDGGFKVWNVRTGELVQSLPTYSVFYLAVSPDQKRIAVFFRDEVRLFSINITEAGKP